MKSDQYYIDELEEKLLETVSLYMRKVTRPYGLLLSGGFDSGLLAALTKPDVLYRVQFYEADVRYDETRYADAIATHLGVSSKVKTLHVSSDAFKENIKSAVLAMGEPISHFSLVPFYMLMKFIKEQHEVLPIDILSGEGPDEYLGGYARQIVFDELRKLYDIPELRNYRDVIKKVFGFENLALRYQEFMGYSGYPLGLEEYPLQGKIGKMDMELGTIEEMEQKLALANGVNLHYPYINEQFAEYCYMLPDHLKIRNGVTKWAFRQIAMKYLPEFMRNRSKMGGPVAPVNEWLGLGVGYDKEKWLQIQREILYGPNNST